MVSDLDSCYLRSARPWGIGLLLALASCVQARVVGSPGVDGSGQTIPGGGGSGGGGSGIITIKNDGGHPLASYDATQFSPPDLPPPITDFPPDPVLDGVPSNTPDLFANTPARTSSSLCIVAPEANTLLPKNWLRPRFEFYAPAQENLFEITISVASFAHPLRIYTAGETTHTWHTSDRSYALSWDWWNKLRSSVVDTPITVQVRAMTVSSAGAVQIPPSPPATTTFTIAPVEAPGKIVYWALANTTSGNVGSLRGFGIGEEGVEDVLLPGQVQAKSAVDTCIGCHAATPDGLSVGMVLGPSNYFESVADIQSLSVGKIPSYVDPGAVTALRKIEGATPAYSKAHWGDGDRIEITSSTTGILYWVQLDSANQQGVLARSGDPNLATEPTFSHDGTTIAYVSSPNSGSTIYNGRLANGPADLYTIPYNNRAGGPASPVAGAATAENTEYYPAFSPDDSYLAYSRFAGNGNSYSNNASEVFVVPSTGGTAQRLAANDPPACLSGVASPGLTNDWPKWSPHATMANGKTYYWLTFSSARSGKAQLYVTGLVLEGGKLTTYPAVYLWNQPSAESNHTPCWDDWQIPDIPPVL